VRYEKRDITTVQAPGIISHGVNCQNVMGSGVAKALFTKWPKVKSEYHKHQPEHGYHQGSTLLGSVQFVVIEPGLIVANCFTQEYYGRDFGKRYADPRAVYECLEEVASYARTEWGLNEVHMPRIGCGLGGLDWEEDVVPSLESIEWEWPIDFVVCDV